MSHAAVYSLLVGDTQLSAQGIQASTVFASNAMDSLPRESPSIILHWGPRDNKWGLRDSPGKTLLTVWVHDRGGSYDRINVILKRVRQILSSSFHVVGSDGETLTQADWRGDSDDLKDDGYKTITKNSLYEIVSRETV